tara:strand:- start:11729 stop:11938 length:210 start_codon:yes stop_codon:yes gene_type:complete
MTNMEKFNTLSEEEMNKEYITAWKMNSKLDYLGESISFLMCARDLASDKIDRGNIEYLIQLIQDTLEDY